MPNTIFRTLRLVAALMAFFTAGCAQSKKDAELRQWAHDQRALKTGLTVLPKGVIDGDIQPEVEESQAHHDIVSSRGTTKRFQRFLAEGSLVSNQGIPLIQQTQTAGGLTPVERAEVVAQRLNDLSATDTLQAELILVRLVDNTATVFASPLSNGGFGQVLATVDGKTAAQFGFENEPGLLAFWWRDVLRDHVLIISGKPPIYTTPYAQPMQRLYGLCRSQGVPTPKTIENALSQLSPAEKDALQSLYINVPSNYRPQITDTNAAK